MLASTIVVLLHFTVCSCICRCFFPLGSRFLGCCFVVCFWFVHFVFMRCDCHLCVDALCVCPLCACHLCDCLLFSVHACCCSMFCIGAWRRHGCDVYRSLRIVLPGTCVRMFTFRCLCLCSGCLVRPQRLCSEDSNADTKMPFIGVGICAPRRGLSTATCGNMVSVCSCR